MIRFLARKIGWALATVGDALWSWGFNPIFEYQRSKADHPAGRGIK